MIRILIEEERVTSYAEQGTPEVKEWKVVMNAAVDDPKVIAGILRSAADKYDPPQRPHR